MKAKHSIMIIAGEVSGDLHAAKLVRAVRTRRADVEVFGIGGDEMRAAGTELVHHVDDMAVMGLTDVLRRFWFFRRVFHEMLDLARTRRPDMVLLVDYPGFNLRFAARAHRLGLKVVYYICPQVWAWNRSRIPRMAAVVDRLLTIFPFEPDHFEGTGLRVDFVGHPLVDEAQAAFQAPAADLPWNGDLRVALLPGSREHEIERMLPAMTGAAVLIERKHPDAAFIIAAPSPQVGRIVRQHLESQALAPSRCSVVEGQTRQVLRQARAALVTSGTATVEAALMRCPMVIAYRMAALTFLFARRLVKVDHIAMANIVAGERVCPEFVQNDVSPGALAEALDPFLGDTTERAGVVGKLKRVAAALGPGGAEQHAADIVVEELDAARAPGCSNTCLLTASHAED